METLVTANFDFVSEAEDPAEITNEELPPGYALTCTLCGFASSSVSEMELHGKTYHADQVASCSLQTQPTEEETFNRFPSEPEPGYVVTVLVKCDNCEFTTSSTDEISLHIETTHEDAEPNSFKTFRVVRVSKKVINKFDSVSDKDVSTSLVKCKNCEFTTASTNEMQLHIETEHENTDTFSFETLKGVLMPEMNKCDYCEFSTSKNDEMQRHFEEEHANSDPLRFKWAQEDVKIVKPVPQIVKCNNCELTTKTTDEMRLHIETKHENSDPSSFKTIHVVGIKRSPQKTETKLNFVSVKETLNEKAYNKLWKQDSVKRCPYTGCDYFSHRIDNLNGHMVTNHGYTRNMKKCPQCDYTTFFHLKRHMKTHAPKFKCTFYECPFTCTRKFVLRKHLSSIHGQGFLYECPQCIFSASSEYCLSKHVQVHLAPGEKPFQCQNDGCSFTTTNKATFKDHLANKHDVKQYLLKCRKCDFSTSSRYQFVKHKQTHIFQCSSCSFNSKQKLEFDQHISENHGETWRLKNCEHCKFASFSVSTLRRHMISHFQKKNLSKKIAASRRQKNSFTCHYTDCRYSGRFEEALHAHFAKIHGESKYLKNCPHCEFTTAYKGIMSVHVNSHLTVEDQPLDLPGDKKPFIMESHEDSDFQADELPFQCHYSKCNFGTARQVQLNLHLGLIHHEKKYLKHCPHCDFVSVSNLLKPHVNRHLPSERKLFKCYQDGCKYNTKLEEEFYCHLKKNHEQEEDKKSCPHCEFSSGEPRALKRHIESHFLSRKGKQTLKSSLTTENKLLKSRGTTEKKVLKSRGTTEKKLLKSRGTTENKLLKSRGTTVKKLLKSSVATDKKLLKSRVTTEKKLLKSRVSTEKKSLKSRLTEETSFSHSKDSKNEDTECVRKCEFCDFTTGFLFILKRHQSKHPEQAIKENLLKIKTEEEGDLIQKCEFCDFTTGFPFILKTHLKRHAHEITKNRKTSKHSVMKYLKNCALCDFNTSSTMSLKKHITTHLVFGEHLKQTRTEPQWVPEIEVHKDGGQCPVASFDNTTNQFIDVKNEVEIDETEIKEEFCSAVTFTNCDEEREDFNYNNSSSSFKNNFKEHIVAKHSQDRTFGKPNTETLKSRNRKNPILITDSTNDQTESKLEKLKNHTKVNHSEKLDLDQETQSSPEELTSHTKANPEFDHTNHSHQTQFKAQELLSDELNQLNPNKDSQCGKKGLDQETATLSSTKKLKRHKATDSESGPLNHSKDSQSSKKGLDQETATLSSSKKSKSNPVTDFQSSPLNHNKDDQGTSTQNESNSHLFEQIVKQLTANSDTETGSECGPMSFCEGWMDDEMPTQSKVLNRLANDSKLDLKSHLIEIKSSQDLYKCQITGCGFITNLMKSLNSHLAREHHDKRYYKKCPFCDFSAVSYNSKMEKHVEMHLKRVEALNSYFGDSFLKSCAHCNYKTVFRGSLKKHLKTHFTETKSFANLSEDSAKGFENRISDELSLHDRSLGEPSNERPIKLNQNFVLLKCNHADTKSLKNSDDIKVEAIDLNSDVIKIETNRNFDDVKIEKYDHRQVRFKYEPGEAKRPKKRFLFKCRHEGCNYSSVNRQTFYSHLGRNHGEKQFVENCPHCDYSTAIKSYLKKHIAGHCSLKDMPLKCHYNCGYGTANESLLNAHLAKIHGEKQFVENCPHCKFTTANRSYLKKHIATHLPPEEMPLRCHYEGCGFGTAFKSILQSHLGDKHGEKKWMKQCPHCNFTTAHGSHLKKHLESHLPPDQRSFQCPYEGCAFSSAFKNGYHYHLGSVHGETKYLKKKVQKLVSFRK